MPKTALVLSGGGAKGAFQVGAENYLREKAGYSWDIIAGVSVGALNGAMLAMGRYKEMEQTWAQISDEKFFTGPHNRYFAPLKWLLPESAMGIYALARLILGKPSIFGYAPLKQMVDEHFDLSLMQAELLVGAVSLVDGTYRTFTKADAGLRQAILASAVMPVIWPPVNVPPDFAGMVDGGLINISPLGDVLDRDPDRVVIINCSSDQVAAMEQAPTRMFEIAKRSLEIILAETFQSDLREFLRINDIVGQVDDATSGRLKLRHRSLRQPEKPEREYKRFEALIISPEAPLPDTLDFSQPSIRRSMEAGRQQAQRAVAQTASSPPT